MFFFALSGDVVNIEVSRWTKHIAHLYESITYSFESTWSISRNVLCEVSILTSTILRSQNVHTTREWKATRMQFLTNSEWVFQNCQFFLFLFLPIRVCRLQMDSSVSRVGFLSSSRAYALTDDNRYSLLKLNSADDVDVVFRLLFSNTQIY